MLASPLVWTAFVAMVAAMTLLQVGVVGPAASAVPVRTR